MPSIEGSSPSTRTAILVLSTDGLALARRLRAAWPGPTSIFAPGCVVGACGGVPGGGPDRDRDAPLPGTFDAGEPGVHGWNGPLRRVFPAIWDRFDAIVAVMALGVVVRLAGPLAVDKRRDPALVAVDEAGAFATSVVNGHGPGADRMAVEVANILGATAVITAKIRPPRSHL